MKPVGEAVVQVIAPNPKDPKFRKPLDQNAKPENAKVSGFRV